MVQIWAISEEVPTRCVNTGKAIARHNLKVNVMQSYQATNNTFKNQELLEETSVVLELLAFAISIMAQPGTPATLSKVLAILSYNCAINWAAMLTTDFPVVEGGAQ